jgi:uncharacterized membrane protein
LSYKDIAEFVAIALELAGVAVIAGGIALAVISYLRGDRLQKDTSAYAYFRRALGRSILLGLEFLVAADIIYTVATPPTFNSLGVLGLLIVIRTFLSIEIEMELDGKWPWEKDEPASHEAHNA